MVCYIIFVCLLWYHSGLFDKRSKSQSICCYVIDWGFEDTSKPLGVAVIVFCVLSLVTTFLSVGFALFVYKVTYNIVGGAHFPYKKLREIKEFLLPLMMFLVLTKY